MRHKRYNVFIQVNGCCKRPESEWAFVSLT